MAIDPSFFSSRTFDAFVGKGRRLFALRRAALGHPVFSPASSDLRSLAKRGRLSEQALRDVLDAISSVTNHPTAYDINRTVRKRHPRASLGSTYRALHALVEAGFVKCYDFGDGITRFEVARSAANDHLIDVSSGRVEEFSSDELATRLTELAAKLGFRLLAYRLVLHVESVPSRSRSLRPKASLLIRSP